MAPAPDAPLTFSPREWLALFPAAPPRNTGACAVPGAPPADPAGALRASEPLTREALLAALSPSPLLAGMTRAQLSLARWAVQRIRLRYYLLTLSGAMLLAVVWPANAALGRFTPGQLGVGTAVVLTNTSVSLVSLLFIFRGIGARFASPVDLSTHPLAVFARWAQLCSAGDPGGTLSPLVAHAAEDSLCPCSDCSRDLLARAGALRVAEFVARFSAAAFWHFVFHAWMPAITLGAYTWATPWAAVLCCIYFAISVEFHVTMLVAASPSNIAALQLSLRLHNRAAGLALSDMLGRYDRLLLDAASIPGDPRAPASEPYALLHDGIAGTWRRRISSLNSGATVVFAFGIIIAGTFVVGLASGNCVLGPTLFLLLYTVLLIAMDLANFAAANSHPSAIVALYASARTSLLRMGCAAAASAAPPPAHARELAAAQDRLLGAYVATAPSFFASFMGFRVSAAVLRNAAATAFTLGVGLWSVLKGAGVGFTMNTTCG